MKARRIVVGALLAAVGLLALVGVAAAAVGGSPQPQSGSAAPAAQEAEDGWLGVKVMDISEGVKAKFNIAVTSGAAVVEVAKDGPADQAGIQVGDVIQIANGQAIASADALEDMIEDLAPGTQVALGLARGLEGMTITVILGEKPKPEKDRRPKVEEHPVVPGFLRQFISPILFGNVLHAEFQLLEKTGTVVAIALDNGKIQAVTDPAFSIVRKDGTTMTFTATTDTRVLVAGHRINLSGLRADTPVLVVRKDGTVILVLAWPGDLLGHRPEDKKGPGPGPKHLDIEMLLRAAPEGSNSGPGNRQDIRELKADPATAAFIEQLRIQMPQGGSLGPKAEERMRDLQKEMQKDAQEVMEKAMKERAKQLRDQSKDRDDDDDKGRRGRG
ncbi:MAG: PDZ domain-containing protein [Chloroflexi bacterium]|nr:PDZ domain-containing protein [Chloroflexota bacterium]